MKLIIRFHWAFEQPFCHKPHSQRSNDVLYPPPPVPYLVRRCKSVDQFKDKLLLLPVMGGIWDILMDRSEFLRIVKQQFPDLREPINKEQGLLHFKVAVLRRYTQKAIFDGDRQALKNCFKVAERAYSEGNRHLKIAIDTSFVEDLDFVTPHNRYDWAWDMLPAKLKSLYKAFHSDILHHFDTANNRPL